MLFTKFNYNPRPAVPDVRLYCLIQRTTELVSTQYQINSQHRDHNPNKSQWIISCEEELSVFAGSVNESIVIDGQYMWGIYIPGMIPEALGVTRFGDESKLAIFDNGKHNGFWHGYPADYIRNQEIPSGEVFDLWRKNGFLKKADVNKIIKGQW